MNIHPLLEQLLETAVGQGASDLHMIANLPAALRVHGEIIFAGGDALNTESLADILTSLLNPLQMEKFEREWELCFSIQHALAGRLRITVYRHNGLPELSIRFCGDRIHT